MVNKTALPPGYESNEDLEKRIAKFTGQLRNYSWDSIHRRLLDEVVRKLAAVEHRFDVMRKNHKRKYKGPEHYKQNYCIELRRMVRDDCECNTSDETGSRPPFDECDVICDSCLFWLATAPALERCIAICLVLDEME